MLFFLDLWALLQLDGIPDQNQRVITPKQYATTLRKVTELLHIGMGCLNGLVTPFNFCYETNILQVKPLMLVTCSWCGLSASTIIEPMVLYII